MFDVPLPDSPLTRESPHSAAVTLTLVTKDGTFPLREIGSNRIVLSEVVHIPAGQAEVLMTVDGRKYLWDVVLQNDVVPFDSDKVRVRLRNGRPVT